MNEKIKLPPHSPSSPRRVWVVSACLLGESCRYDGSSASEYARKNIEAILDETLVPICPEQMGGLPTPRVPAQLEGGNGEDVLLGLARVRNVQGEDVTDAFLRGAESAFQIAQNVGATHACLKARSPSCGVGRVHSSTGLRRGDGVAAARLKAAGLQVYSDESLTE